ncbi:MAG: hypothetical protein H6625_11855 [Bdellovibrionaceae bacterium]|nr:hypothetical protein [Pseudobdellovibrionaceae bacterium]
MKANPLFVDSTKTRGDNVKTIFELSGLLLRDNERLLLKIIEEPQVRQHEVLMKTEEDTYSARVFLQHQNKIRYQFVILNETRVILASNVFEDRVNYLIENKWEPSQTLDLIFDKRNENKQKNQQHYQQFQENKNILGNLIKQWGL